MLVKFTMRNMPIGSGLVLNIDIDRLELQKKISYNKFVIIDGHILNTEHILFINWLD